MYKIVVGNISSARLLDWFQKNENPYAVWEGNAIIEEICYVNTWTVAEKFLRDRVYIDWGSVAWRANREEISRFFKDASLDVTQVGKLKGQVDYAVVFIESSGEF